MPGHPEVPLKFSVTHVNTRPLFLSTKLRRRRADLPERQRFRPMPPRRFRGGAPAIYAILVPQSPPRPAAGVALELDVLDLHELSVHQLTPLLELESRAWHEGLHWDFGYAVRQISSGLREKRIWGYALMTQREPRGYCIYYYDGPKALIGDLFLDPALDDSRHACGLVGRVVETLLLNPASRRIEAQLPHFNFEQLEPFFRGRCFEGYRRHFMAVSLANRPAPKPTAARASTGSAKTLPPAEDFLIVPWDRKYDSDAAQLLHGVYRQHVDTVINDLYSSLDGTRRLIDNVVHFRGCGDYLSQASRVAIHRPTQKLAAVLAVTGVRRGTAHIAQIAVANQFQAAGLGTAMMESSFRSLAEQGYREVSLTVTELNWGAVRLYERLGFETFRTFGAFVWKRPE